ncbi:MarR family winged helix-turn-helix transcriptional regulator [Paenibacillus hexagrammi]|uniref:MarR family transcriptional regulator n=1 Tax=Paenibacillus hexagrammi TaxID=2908839 RepID=A0ABY3SLE1_9BACL|nr:MarR family transcriptional regulator [Paenibacillus sp. YPD9-1]UJF34044.1 MarR family transcriptional regulator [Paenibacillus sp. YPD9-1]
MAHDLPLQTDLAALLSMSFSAIIHELHQRLDALGFDDIRPAHGFLFQRINPDGATGMEIAEHLGITKQAVSQMIDYLEQHEYVARRQHPKDGRGKIIVLTERGWQLIHAREAFYKEIEQQWAAIIGSERLEHIKSDLSHIILNIHAGEFPQRLRPVW